MLRTITTRPRFTDLTLVATLKTEIVLLGSADDAFITSLIKMASSAILNQINRDVARQGWHEGLESIGTTILTLTMSPVVSISQVTKDAGVVDPALYSISNPDAGFLFNQMGWWSTEIYGRSGYFSSTYERLPQPPDPTRYFADYFGGWLLPGDDVVANTGISVIASDQSFNITGVKWPLLQPGDVFSPSGSAHAANIGSFTVLSATNSKVIVSDGTPLVDESAGPAITVAVRNLPYDIERACIETVKGWFFSRDRDWTTKMERIGGTRAGAWQAEYEADQALPPQAISLLAPYVRYC